MQFRIYWISFKHNTFSGGIYILIHRVSTGSVLFQTILSTFLQGLCFRLANMELQNTKWKNITHIIRKINQKKKKNKLALLTITPKNVIY